MDDSVNDATVRTVVIHRISETQKTFRYAIVVAGICFFGWLVKDAIVDIVTDKKPVAVLIVTSILGAFGLGASPLIFLRKWIQRLIKRLGDRPRDLEESIDPDRTSSNVRKDGTLPDD